MVTAVQLSALAVRYVREELATAPTHPLAEALRRSPWEQGTFWTFAPMHIPAEELLDLRTVKVATNEEGRACWRAFLAFVEEYLHAGGRRALVMSNPFHKRPDNPFYHSLTLGRAWADWCVCGNFFCFYALDTADTTQIDYVFDDVQAVTTIGVLVRDVELPWHVDLPQATIDDMATRADYVLLNSYDDSGMLIWSRTGTLKSQ